MAKMLGRLDSLASQLRTACDDLNDCGPNAAANMLQALDPSDQKLMEISRDVAGIAHHLQSEVTKLTTGPLSMRRSLSKAIKSMWRKGYIDEIQQKMEKSEKLMHTILLIDLR